MTTPIDVFGMSKPRMYKYTKAAEGCIFPELAIGLELETEQCNEHGSDIYKKIANAHNFELATDGSLRGNAYEFISRPMRTDFALAALEDFLASAKFDDKNYSDRCSVHVHVNCTDMQMEQISTLALLYTVLEEIMFEFVGASRDTNIYCIPWSQCRQHLDLINKFLANPADSLKRWNKYTALNLIPLANLGTVEFRQMHGTADMKKLSLWINLIGSLFKWAKTYALKDLIGELKELNSNSQYEAFFNKVVSGLLPYNEVYRTKLEEGVILAKFSLVNMERKRGKPSLKTEVFVAPAAMNVEVDVDMFEAVGDARMNAIRNMQRIAQADRARAAEANLMRNWNAGRAAQEALGMVAPAPRAPAAGNRVNWNEVVMAQAQVAPQPQIQPVPVARFNWDELDQEEGGR